jgi:hypothetical protein
LEQQVLATGTLELELFRSQGKLSFLGHLEQLKANAQASLNEKEEETNYRGLPYA